MINLYNKAPKIKNLRVGYQNKSCGLIYILKF